MAIGVKHSLHRKAKLEWIVSFSCTFSLLLWAFLADLLLF